MRKIGFGMMVVLGAVGISGSARADIGAFDGPDDGPLLVEDDGGGEVQTPLVPRVNQILIPLSNNGASAGKARDDAEDKLVELGPGAASLLKSLIESHKGRARDALAVAAFRLENAPLKPRQAIGEWMARRTFTGPADPGEVAARAAEVVVGRVASDDLRKVFPNHLFYTAELTYTKPGKGGGVERNATPIALVAVAADGKVQPIGDDASLANFLKHELPDGTGKAEQRRNAAAAAVLALGRDAPEGADITADGQVDEASTTGTAFVTDKPNGKITITLSFDSNRRVSGVVTKKAESKALAPKKTDPVEDHSLKPVPGEAPGENSLRPPAAPPDPPEQKGVRIQD